DGRRRARRLAAAAGVVAPVDGAVGRGRRAGPVEHEQPVRPLLHDQAWRLRHRPRAMPPDRRSAQRKPDARQPRRPHGLPREPAPAAAGGDSDAPRDCGIMSELSKPILPGTAATDYERYLRTDELLALQKDPRDVVHHDEHLFQAVHQTSELWLKLACQEIERATTLIEGDGTAAAARLVRRANECLSLITPQPPLLDRKSPA